MLALVGCGFLGGLFAEEIGKRLWALDTFLSWRTVDGDNFARRNAANQACRPHHVGNSKAHRAALVLQDYGQDADGRALRITGDNVADVLPPETALIVDCVDNVPSRQLLWALGLQRGIPVLHVGLSRGGSGAVEWTLNEKRDAFSLSPDSLIMQGVDPAALVEGPELKPCELLTHRRVGWLTAHAAAVALGNYYGLDPEEAFPDRPGLGVAWSCVVTEQGIRQTNLWEVDE